MFDAPSRLRLRVAPASRSSAVIGRHGDAWKVRVTAAPEGGRANAQVLAVIAAALDVTSAEVRLVAGASSRNKIVEFDGIGSEEAERRLERAASHPAKHLAGSGDPL